MLRNPLLLRLMANQWPGMLRKIVRKFPLFSFLAGYLPEWQALYTLVRCLIKSV